MTQTIPLSMFMNMDSLEIIVLLTLIVIHICEPKFLFSWFGFGSENNLVTIKPLQEKNNSLEATCIMDGTGVGNIISTLHLKEAGGKLFIDGVIFGLHHDDKPHLHGFHIHEYGKVGSRCLDAGAHFNPQGSHHGGPKDKVRHIGDLGNVRSSRGKLYVNVQDSQALLSGKYSVLGKALVLHAKPDDFGRGKTEDSLRTGNTGSRLACCVIKLNDWKTYTLN